MKPLFLSIITVAALTFASPAFARGHGHSAGRSFSGGHARSFSAGHNFSGTHSFSRPSGVSRLHGPPNARNHPGFSRSTLGAGFRAGPRRSRSSQVSALRGPASNRSFASHTGPGHSFNHRHHGRHHDSHHHDIFLGSAFYGWPYYGGYGYGRYGYGSYYGNGYDYANASLTDVQSALAELGYYRGPIDGVFGPGTQQAIVAFQARNGLRPTGRVDQNLLAALRAD